MTDGAFLFLDSDRTVVRTQVRTSCAVRRSALRRHYRPDSHIATMLRTPDHTRVSRVLVVVTLLVAGIARAANACMEAATTASLADSARIDKGLDAAIEALAQKRNGGDLAERVLRHIFTDERYYAGQLDGNIEVHGFCSDKIMHRSPGNAACLPAFIASDPCSCAWQVTFNARSGRFFDFHIGGCA